MAENPKAKNPLSVQLICFSLQMRLSLLLPLRPIFDKVHSCNRSVGHKSRCNRNMSTHPCYNNNDRFRLNMLK